MAKVSIKSVQAHKVWQFDAHHHLLTAFPDFLIIGPQRTGTTWLAANLMAHPQVIFSEPKELFFLNNLQNPESPWFAGTDLAWYLRHFYCSPAKMLQRVWQNYRQYRQFLPILARGEGTASTAVETTEPVMDAIISVNPHLKIILMVRNPIQRAWAHAKKDLLNVSYRNAEPRGLDDISHAEYEEFFSQDYLRTCGDYEYLISKWSAKFPTPNIYIGFFDDITNSPVELLCSLYQFLGVNHNEQFTAKLGRKRILATDAKSGPRPMPDPVMLLLNRLYGDGLEYIESRFGRRFIL